MDKLSKEEVIKIIRSNLPLKFSGSLDQLKDYMLKHPEDNHIIIKDNQTIDPITLF